MIRKLEKIGNKWMLELSEELLELLEINAENDEIKLSIMEEVLMISRSDESLRA